MEHRLFHSVTHGVPLENLSDRAVLLGLRLDWGWGCRKLRRKVTSSYRDLIKFVKEMIGQQMRKR